jgi:hypothetical protein
MSSFPGHYFFKDNMPDIVSLSAWLDGSPFLFLDLEKAQGQDHEHGGEGQQHPAGCCIFIKLFLNPFMEKIDFPISFICWSLVALRWSRHLIFVEMRLTPDQVIVGDDEPSGLGWSISALTPSGTTIGSRRTGACGRRGLDFPFPIGYCTFLTPLFMYISGGDP